MESEVQRRNSLDNEGETMLCNYSNLKSADIEAIKNLESKLAKTLLAVSCHEVKPAALKEDELSEIRNLESKIGVALVAVTAA